MYQRRTPNAKKDPVRRWQLPDRVFFACGACHILAYAFLDAYPAFPAEARWLKPRAGYTGNHIVVVGEGIVFDYHGYSSWTSYWHHTRRKARRRWAGWDADFVALPKEVLISEARSREFDGLWLRAPGHFLYDAMPRAKTYLSRFAPPEDYLRCQRARGQLLTSGG